MYGLLYFNEGLWKRGVKAAFEPFVEGTPPES